MASNFGGSGGGRPRFPPRSSQMSEQSNWLEERKRQIEEKLKKKQEIDEAEAKKAIEETKDSKDRKGGEGDSTNVKSKSKAPVAKASSSVKNTFHNDGSFMAQFRQQMKERQREQASSAAKRQKIEAESPDPSTSGQATSPPPSAAFSRPPPSNAPPAAPTPAQKSEEDGWYKAALAKAQAAAKNMSRPPTKSEPVEPSQPKPPIAEVERPAAALPPQASGTQKSGEGDWYKSALAKAQAIAKNMSSPPNPDATGNPDAAADNVSSPKVHSEPEQEARPGPSSTTTAVTAATPDGANILLPTVADELASLVAVNGDQVEIMAREKNLDEPELSFLQDVDGDLYKQYRSKIEWLRHGFKEEGKAKRKKSRWGDESDKVDLGPANPNPKGRSTELLMYAQRVFGSTDLEDHQWKQCEDQLKMNMVYQDLVKMQVQMQQNIVQAGERKYEYDSDEDTEGGTWEHKARSKEMDKTRDKATELTRDGGGSHHIGDFLPPGELTKFLAKYSAVKKGESFDESDYQDSKLKQDNMGFKMLQKMGWAEGSGLGTSGQGITAPINQGKQSSDKTGVGISDKPHELEQDDNEFDAYRKRMMLAYKFRPNPLNNPRRAYY